MTQGELDTINNTGLQSTLTLPDPDIPLFDEAPGADFSLSEELDFSNLDNLEVGDGTLFTAVNQTAVSSTTVSPQELYLNDFSAPASGTTGYLSTPSLIDGTPDLSSYECSPAFSTMDADTNWNNVPLFPDATQKDEPLFPSASVESLQEFVVPAPPRKSMSAASPATPNVDHKELLRRTIGINGVVKSSRRQTKELAPIAVDDEDEIAVKRARNTMAARKSRQKKRDIEDALRQALEEMTASRDRWRMLAVKHGAPIDLD